MTIKERYDGVLRYFRANVPEAGSELHFENPYQLICAVMLSAQCTDRRENMVTPRLFELYPRVQDLAAATAEQVLPLISSISYPNSKAGHLVNMARQLVERFGGEVPSDIDDLMSLPGVGRKTANVIMAVAFGEAKMPVDTHVFRVSHRLGLVSKTDNTPLKVERKLVKYIPEQDVAHAHHWLLLHGRYVCTSRAPHCAKCDLADICPKIMEGSKLNA